MSASSYPLGTADEELARLAFQHEVWGGVTRAFLDRLKLERGARVVDLGCGPGFVTAELAARVGRSGGVLAVDESPRWIERVEAEAELHGWTQVRAERARLQELELEDGAYDLLFARWVFSFVPEPGAVLARLARALRPGGLVALQDYNHEGIALFPDSAGFRAVVRATRELYRRSGGDLWVAGRARSIFRAAGLETVALVPHVLCGAPGSPAFRWAGRFFAHFSQKMQDEGLLAPEERALFLAEWRAREADPDALFFSPIVVDALARKPG